MKMLFKGLQLFIRLGIIAILLLSKVTAIEFTLTRIAISLKYHNIKRGLSEINNKEDNYLSINRKIEGLYTIELVLGSNKQKMNVILDTGSSLFWVSDTTCKNCLASNLYKSTESNTLTKSTESMSLNYLTGKITGLICNDQLTLLSSQSPLNNFSFLLANEITAPIEIEGLIGFQRHYNQDNIKYSIINSLYSDHFIKQRAFAIDSTGSQPKLYIGEIPSYLQTDRTKAQCNCEDSVKYWNCRSSVQIGNEFKSKEELLLLFDTGTNALIFPRNMIDDIKEHMFSIKAFDEDCNAISGSYISITCSREYIDKNTMRNNMTFVISNSRIELNVNKLFNEDNEFQMYFGTVPNEGVIIGQPFFEQYATVFNMENNSVSVYINEIKGDKEDVEKPKEEREVKGDDDKVEREDSVVIDKVDWLKVTLNIIFWLFGIVLVIGMILIIYIWFKRKRIPMEMIGFESQSYPIIKNDF